MTDLADLNRAIGQLEGKMDLMLANQARQAERATHLEAAMVRLDSRVLDTEQALDPLVKLAEESKNWKQRGIGALAVVGVLSSGITAVIGTFWSQIWSAWRG